VKILVKILKSVIAILLVFYAVYAVINGPALYLILKDRISPKSAVDTQKEEAVDKLLATKATPVPTNVVSAQRSPSATTSQPQNDPKSAFKNDWMYYATLGIEAPIDWDIQPDNINKLLPNALVHTAESASPDEGGDVVIAGHSSDYWWKDSPYRTIFAPLVRAATDDTIVIKKHDKIYVYNVRGTQTIGASEGFKVERGGDFKHTLNLMTCVPVGTNLKRLIVTADLAKVY